MEIKRIGLNLAKNAIELLAVVHQEKPLFRKARQRTFFARRERRIGVLFHSKKRCGLFGQRVTHAP
jgi:hypothetical protein